LGGIVAEIRKKKERIAAEKGWTQRGNTSCLAKERKGELNSTVCEGDKKNID